MGRFREASNYGDHYSRGTDIDFPDGVPVCIFANQGGGATADHNVVNQIHIPKMTVNVSLTIQSLVVGGSELQTLSSQQAQPMGLLDMIKQFFGMSSPGVHIQGSLPQVQDQLQKAIEAQVGKAMIAAMENKDPRPLLEKGNPHV